MVGAIWSVADLLRGDYKASDYGKLRMVAEVSPIRYDWSECGSLKL